MIKYERCHVQKAHFVLLPQESYKNAEFIKKVFALLEEKNLEEKLYDVQPGQRIFLYSYMLGETDEVCIFFRCTGNKKGHFTQRIEDPTGRYFHSDSMEFTFE